MKIKPRKQSFKRISIIVAILISILVIGIFSVLIRKNHISSPQGGNPSITSSPKPTDRLNVQPALEDPGAHQHGVDGTKTSNDSAGAAAFPTTQPNLAIEITGTQQSDNQLIIGTVISPKTSGSCTIELTRTDNPSITRSSNIASTGDTSYCQINSLDITKASSGEWSLTVKVQVNNNVATATKLVTIK